MTGGVVECPHNADGAARGRAICQTHIPGGCRCTTEMGEASKLRRIPIPSQVPSRCGDAAVARETATRGMVISLWGGGDAAELECIRGTEPAERAVAAGMAFLPATTASTVGA